ncbi:hypothetical protein VFPFJ_06960 [Purpureocillium lilacinum]|uniref:Uncharacterized protein n=1 Tax=Purpureocillium lilacinum TaxID=33203 RepID=A0A179HE07_PURLI|nr:hypothetical protein VFPFJ_06960 [Purpureocillium lilacinum]OAQ88495.1 hypothetical protein VFPFJ_06960 [Purpureocillium lilacinum]
MERAPLRALIVRAGGPGASTTGLGPGAWSWSCPEICLGLRVRGWGTMAARCKIEVKVTGQDSGLPWQRRLSRARPWWWVASADGTIGSPGGHGNEDEIPRSATAAARPGRAACRRCQATQNGQVGLLNAVRERKRRAVAPR